jgi:LacI family fructose operon transcriptional repressor
MAHIKDVALAAGVSTATVSRVLSGQPGVSEALRQKVQEAVNRLAYRPNLAARRLRASKTETVGLIVSDVRNPFFTSISRAVEDMAYREGKRVILCNADEDADKEAFYLGLMTEENVCGVILSPTRSSSRQLDIAAYPFPIITIDRPLAAGTCDSVTLDNRTATGWLIDHLASRGYRHIGGLFGSTSTTGAARQAGFHEALSRLGLKGESRLATPSREVAEQEIGKWLKEKNRPQAFVLSNGLFSLGALQAIREAKLAIPADIALAGFDDEPWTALVEPGLTVIAQPTYEIGRTAMELLLQRIAQPDRPVRQIELAGELIVRSSTCGRPANAGPDQNTAGGLPDPAA